jgi:hypothetical protein
MARMARCAQNEPHRECHHISQGSSCRLRDGLRAGLLVARSFASRMRKDRRCEASFNAGFRSQREDGNLGLIVGPAEPSFSRVAAT